MKQLKSLLDLELVLDVAQTEGKSVIIDFFATWCVPCKKIAPEFEKLSQSNPNIIFVKTDIDIAQDIAEQFNIQSIPTFAVFKNKSLVKRYTGANIEDIKKLIY